MDVRWLLRMALPVFLSTTFGIIAYKIDTVMIMEILGKFAAGIYTTGHRPLDLLVILPNLFATALFPSLQRYRETGENPVEDVQRMAERSLRYLHLLVFPIMAVCILGAKPLIGLLASGEEFAPAASVFAIVILGLPLVAANTVYNRVLLAMNRERVFLKLASIVMVVNVGLNLVLIPLLEWNGAAIATVGSQVVSHLLHRNYIHHTGLRIPWRRGHLLGPWRCWRRGSSVRHPRTCRSELGRRPVPPAGRSLGLSAVGLLRDGVLLCGDPDPPARGRPRRPEDPGLRPLLIDPTVLSARPR